MILSRAAICSVSLAKRSDNVAISRSRNTLETSANKHRTLSETFRLPIYIYIVYISVPIECSPLNSNI